MVFGGTARELFSPRPARALVLSQLAMYLAISALFFSSIITWLLPEMPALSGSTYCVLTPA
jgi:hypothetical protein